MANGNPLDLEDIFSAEDKLIPLAALEQVHRLALQSPRPDLASFPMQGDVHVSIGPRPTHI